MNSPSDDLPGSQSGHEASGYQSDDESRADPRSGTSPSESPPTGGRLPAAPWPPAGSGEDENPFANRPVETGPEELDSVVTPSPTLWKWSILTIVTTAVMAIGLAMFVQIMVIVVAYFLTHDMTPITDQQALARWVNSLSTRADGIVLLVLPGQLTFFAVAVLGGLISRQSFNQRLGLQVGRYPRITWAVLALASPAIGVLTMIVMNVVMQALQLEPSEHLQSLERMFVGQRGSALVLMMMTFCVFPGLCEELLFRGFVMRGLLRSVIPSAAILISGCLFALAHLDPMHSLGVLPLGIWLGYISWKTDSLWPAVLGHMANNGVSIIATQVDQENPTGVPVMLLGMSVLISIGMLLLSIPLLRADRGGPKPQPLS